MTPMHEVPGSALPGPAAINTSALSKRYGKVTALSTCTISVPEGRISALIGPNGAGKTTLLRLLAGLARPTAGQVTVNGTTPRQDPAFLADIGYLAPGRGDLGRRHLGPGDLVVRAEQRRAA